MAFGRRGVLWLGWTFQLLFTGFSAILCFLTFNNVKGIYDLEWADTDSAENAKHDLWGVMSASLMAGLLVLFYNIISFVILVSKSWHRTGAGFAYGLLVSAAFHMGFFLILAGITQQGWKDSAEAWEDLNVPWSSSDTSVLVATYATSYLASAIFFLMVIVLIYARPAVSKLKPTNTLPTTSNNNANPGSKYLQTGGSEFGNAPSGRPSSPPQEFGTY